MFFFAVSIGCMMSERIALRELTTKGGDVPKDQITFSCGACGSANFIFPNQPPRHDDIISCAGCNRQVGRYDAVRKASLNAAKAEIDKLVKKTFGTKPRWR